MVIVYFINCLSMLLCRQMKEKH